MDEPLHVVSSLDKPVWSRLYEHGMQHMAEKNRDPNEMESSFSFTPNIGQQEYSYSTDGEIFERLHKEKEQKDRDRAFREQMANQKYTFQPNNAPGRVDDTIFERLHEEAMRKKEIVERRANAKNNAECTFKPTVNDVMPYPTPEGSIFDRLYDDAKKKKEVDDSWEWRAQRAVWEQFSFRPRIGSTPGAERQQDEVYDQLYEDAVKKKRLKEQQEMERMRAARRSMFKPRIVDIGVSPKYMQEKSPTPIPAEVEAGLFKPKTNNNKGVSSRYLQPKQRRYEPLQRDDSSQLEVVSVDSNKPPWISPRDIIRQQELEMEEKALARRARLRILLLEEDRLRKARDAEAQARQALETKMMDLLAQQPERQEPPHVLQEDTAHLMQLTDKIRELEAEVSRLKNMSTQGAEAVQAPQPKAAASRRSRSTTSMKDQDFEQLEKKFLYEPALSGECFVRRHPTPRYAAPTGIDRPDSGDALLQRMHSLHANLRYTPRPTSTVSRNALEASMRTLRYEPIRSAQDLSTDRLAFSSGHLNARSRSLPPPTSATTDPVRQQSQHYTLPYDDSHRISRLEATGTSSQTRSRSSSQGRTVDRGNRVVDLTQ
uniref:Uncharacterized protein n=1 Tax=Eutreptiella gymnastica TaxID=73025 RepID=A0A6U7XK83_9EUGL|mmetsp:Transcript_140820/g.245331  ORF Transcript_140820/g.245331 Transcript_140820/m.245331 type:complete len:600 (+) Transcript_140820:99-1898(+)